jgi:uncharacterized membrane protein
MKSVGLWGSILFVTLTACGIHRDKQAPDDLAQLRLSTSYRTINENIFQKNQCLKCHNSSGVMMGGVALDNYSLILTNLNRIERAVLIDQNMPPTGPLPVAQQAALRAWIDNGAPEFPPDTSATTTPTATPTPPPIALQPTYTSIKANILDKKCIICHSVSGTTAKIPFDTYSAILNSPREIVIAGNPDESGMVIFTEIEDSNPKRMPPIKSGIARLSTIETMTIREWIKNGAKNE